MKGILLKITLLCLLISCNKETKQEVDSKKELTEENKTYKSASQIIYNNKACLDSNDRTFPILQLSSDTISYLKPVEGKVFFASDYLRKLAECNGLNYKISFHIKDLSTNFLDYQTETLLDTIAFTVPKNSLKLKSSNKNFDKYIFKCTLRASYFKENKVLGYDTMMPIEKTIYIDNRIEK